MSRFTVLFSLILNKFLPIILLVFPIFVSSQTKFQKLYGEKSFGNVILKVKTGYLLVGRSSPNPTTNMYVVKTNHNGDTIWTKTYGGTLVEYATSAIESNDTGFIIAGYTNSFQSDGGEMLVIKISDDGDLIWSKVIDFNGEDYSHCISPSSDGGYLIGGTTYKGGSSSFDALLVKMDKDGNVMWAKSGGFWNSEIIKSIHQISNGKYFLTLSSTSFGFGSLITVAIDDTGKIISSSVSNTTKIADNITSIKLKNGGFAILNEGIGFGDDDISITKVNSNGQFIWNKNFGLKYSDQPWGIIDQNNGNISICGVTTTISPTIDYRAFLLNLDSSGNILNGKVYGGMDYDKFSGIATRFDNSIVLLGSLNERMYFVCTDSVGNSGCNESAFTMNDTIIPYNFKDANLKFANQAVTIVPAQIKANCGSTFTKLCEQIDLSVPKLGESQFSIYPNPATNELNVEINSNLDDFQICIYDSQGKLIKALNATGFLTKIDLTDIHPGVYWLISNVGVELNKIFIVK